MIRTLTRLALLAPLLALTLLAGCSRASKVARFVASGDSYFDSQTYEQAKIEYLNALRLDPQNAHAIERIGLIWYDQGAPIRALPFLSETAKLSPANLDPRTKLALSYAWLGAMTEARREALAILQISPGDAESLRILDDTSTTPAQIKETRQILAKIQDKTTASYYIAAGGLALHLQDFPTASADLQNALQADPKSSVPHSVMASLYLVQGDRQKAGAEFKAAAELEPQRSTPRLKYAEFLIESGSMQEAQAFLKPITDAAPDYIPAQTLTAKVAFALGKYDDALSIIKTTLAEDSQNLDARLLQGQVLLAQGKAKEALDAMKTLDTTYPNISAIKYQLALAYLQNKDGSSALDQVSQAATISPENIQAVLLLAELNLRKGDANAVAVGMTDLLKRHPAIVLARVLLAEAYWSLNRLDESAALISGEIQLNPDNPQFYLLMGLTLRQQDKPTEARAMFEKGSKLAPGDPRFLYQLADMDVSENNFDDAFALTHAALAKNPRDSAAQFLLARLLFNRGQYDDAEAALQKTLELDPNDASAYDLLISTYVIAKKVDSALAKLQESLAKDPNDLRTLTMLAMIYETKKDYDSARDAYEKVLVGAPDFAPALNNLAFLYSDHFNQLDKAYDLARKARTLLPNDPAIADTYGWVLFKRGDYQQAFALLRDAGSRLPGNAEIQYHLGMAAYSMGQIPAARAAFQQALSAHLRPPASDEANRRLALMQGGTGAPILSVGELETAVSQHPDDVLAWSHLGDAYAQLNNPARAADAYGKAVALNPRLGSAFASLARLYSGPLHDNDKALDFAKKARDISPDDPAVGALLASVAGQAGDYKWAYGLFQLGNATSSGTDPQFQHDFAWTAYALGKTDEAAQIMQHVLTLNPTPAQASDAKAFLTFTALAGQALDAAEPDIQKQLTADPQYVPALMAQAAFDLLHNKSRDAAPIYAQVLGKYPDFTPAQKSLAIIDAADPATAARAYDLATSARADLPDDPDLARLLAQLCYGRKEYPRAIELYQEAARSTPLDARSLYYLGKSFAENKQLPQARDALRQSLAAGLRDPEATDAKRVISPPAKTQ
jgi:tetratricopeptide (TPR) repeat protein